MPVRPAPHTLDQPTLSEADGIRYLHFGTEWIQGAMRIKTPAALVLEYTAQMMAWLLFLEPPKEQSIGLLGLGAGSLARFCLKHTRSPVVAVEWNPQVTAVCQMFFRLPAAERLSVEHDDAAAWVADPRHAGLCPVLMVDLYDASARGPVRDSVAFYSGCRRVLGEVGVLSVNLFGRHESFGRNIENLRKAFDDRILLLPEIDAGNQIVLAFTGPPLAVTPAQLLARAEDVEGQYGLPARRWARALMRHAVDGMLHF
ncbi:spermidine synthase [Bordetella genomosp. 7]|jgi:spermidine synthase|uniref:spermidine synthase n=1 Tax=Bordetella genomosp. 7 TaxID=1416805 RepID=UPI000B9EE576|nr:spermidine synthase [Bordetella genomosp. 7]OZI22283.1 spermidine synthase [Bordetella genomosp. 7]